MKPRELLVRGVNWLGDAVMTTPALTRLREALPSARVTLLTPVHLADLYVGHPAVDEVLTLVPRASPWVTGRRLRERGFDTALVLPNSMRSALECWWARIPRRLGLARGLRRWLLTDPVPVRADARRMIKPSRAEVEARLSGRASVGPFPASAHHALDYLHLAARVGAAREPVAPSLTVLPEEMKAARDGFGLSEGVVWLGLNPGAEYGPAKRWPAERFAAAAREVSGRTRARWVILGGQRDAPLAASIAAQVPGSLPLAGRTTLRQLMAVLASCRLLLTNDTGPMHVAAALGVPVVVPFGSTSPELTGPGIPGGEGRHRMLRSGAACSPCFLRTCPIDLRCLLGIEATTVAEAVLRTLAEGAGTSTGSRDA